MFRSLFSSRLFSSRFVRAVSLTAVASLTAFSTFKLAFAKDDLALDPSKFKAFKLLEIYPVAHNTNRYRFQLENDDQRLGLTVASCLVVKAPIGEGGKDVIKPYTPVSDPQDQGFFDLVVKTYPNGLMSKHLSTLKPGEALDFKGPFIKIPYHPNMKKKIGMIAGGTGITPMFQVINEILKNPADKTQITLVYANLSENDILLKVELDTLARRHRDRFRVFYTIDKSITSFWKGGVGFVTEKMIRDWMPQPSSDNSVFVCGPPGMMNHVSGDKTKDGKQGDLTGLLKKLGYSEDNVFKF